MHMQPYTTVVDWPEIPRVMEVSTMFYLQILRLYLVRQKDSIGTCAVLLATHLNLWSSLGVQNVSCVEIQVASWPINNWNIYVCDNKVLLSTLGNLLLQQQLIQLEQPFTSHQIVLWHVAFAFPCSFLWLIS